MNGLLKWFIIPFLLLSCILTQGQDTDDEHIKLQANQLLRKGGELHREGLYTQALDTFILFLEFRKEIYGPQGYFLAAAYLNIAITYKNLGQYDLALENFQIAEQNYLLKENQNSIYIARLYRNIGNVYRAKLDYKNALNYFEQALAIYLTQQPVDPIANSDAYYAIAELNFLIGNNDIAIKILKENIDKGDEYTQIDFNELLALIYQGLGEDNLSLFYYQRTLKLARNEFEDSDIVLGMIYMNYAEFLLSTNRFNESLINLENAFTIVKASQPSRGEQLSRYYELRGAWFQDKSIETQQINRFKAQKKENLYKSINWYTKGLNALSSSKNEIDINSLRIEDCISFLDCLALLQQIGSAYFDLALIDKEDKSSLYKNSLINALDYYGAASQLTQQARREISSDESKIQLAELEYYTFSQTIEVAYLAYEITDDNNYLELAFNNSEQLKSSAIFDKISDDIAQENSLIPDSLLQYQNKLNGLISIYNQKIFEENNKELPDSIVLADLKQMMRIEMSKQPDSLLIDSYTRKIIKENNKGPDSLLIKEYNEKIFTATRERDELNRLLEEEYSDYYDLKYSNSMLSIRNIQNEMDKEDAILEYVIVEPDYETMDKNESDTSSQLYTFLITKTNSIFRKNTIDAKLDNSLEDVFSFMSNPSYLFTTNNDSKEFCIASHQLYKLLVEPFEQELVNKNLIIIPDGKLNYISFDGLLKTVPDTTKNINFSKLDYLIKDFNINYANSVNILYQNRSKSQNLKNRALAFAPEYDSEKFEMSNATYTLMPLPGVQKEVDAIAETIKTKIFRREEATVQNFRENCANYDILHLAMHAYINDSLPAFSRLVFSSTNGEDQLNKDSWLNTSDIYNLNLNASLAVLSACNTGVGKLQKGEGMMSLARGFLFAGCPSIIMSLWEVEDESGTQIMTSFYKNLKKGKPKDEALRLAKLNYLENSNSRLAHPHYWMSFKSIGDNSPIYTSYDIYFFVLLILLFLAFTIDQTLRIKKVRRKKDSH